MYLEINILQIPSLLVLFGMSSYRRGPSIRVKVFESSLPAKLFIKSKVCCFGSALLTSFLLTFLL